MLLSKYFLPTFKEQPAEALIASHSLMLRSGMIKQQAAGIYSWLPLGLRVLKNIEDIIRLNMNSVGAIELLMPCIQPADLWIQSGRFDNYGKEMLKFKDRHDNMLLFGPTNEDMITDIFRDSIKSYKDLPKNLYHIQWKFRDEIRPRFGVMRAREFLMKDAYSFDIDQESAMKTYNQIYAVYMRIFRDLGLYAVPVLADNGPIGGNLSHEFHILADTGENDLRVRKGIEVGHIFYIGNKYSKAMNAFVNDYNSQLIPVEMSSYGIGISRLVAAIIEANHDERGIIWPQQIAPFKVIIINLGPKDTNCTTISEFIYKNIKAQNIDILYDDTVERPGSKFAIADLIGAPWQIIVGPKKIANGVVELKHRATGDSEELSADIVIKKIVGNLNVK